MHRRNKLGASFVVTVAAGGALMVGCSDHMPVGADSGAVSSSQMCPTTLPSSGAPCALDESRYCSFGGGGPINCPMTMSAHCYHGRWEISAFSCNPPFTLDVTDVTDVAVVIDVTPTLICPIRPPVPGELCTLRDSIVCTFSGTSISCPLYASARCNSGRWVISPISCNPPADVTDVIDAADVLVPTDVARTD
jgi:hypothetical protein